MPPAWEVGCCLERPWRWQRDDLERGKKPELDLADALELLEQEPGLEAGLTDAQRALLAKVP